MIELAAYSVKEIATQEKSRSAVYLELENGSKLYAGMALSSVNTGGDYIDFVAWSSQQAAEETAADILAITPGNFRQQLSRARRDLHSFMQNKCGLVDLSNPCRCERKASGFMKEGWLDPNQ
ncbi:hypothetical protein L3V77_04900 [Vibrio sp. DW001]|uniref:hypothetical protein n=1 Tax=Vibrio sp. DW001 TaxID=2912315 RepID=UPI0023AF29F5|nr:hypothetical protein [Vibrio sp. DW001]WED27575.1 hypothetical protein L3V77_04900 [Vibrio sp. DW001]